MENNICTTCKFAFADGNCNRLVFTSLGMRDRLGSDYKRGNECPFHEQGKPRKENYTPLNFYNS